MKGPNPLNSIAATWHARENVDRVMQVQSGKRWLASVHEGWQVRGALQLIRREGQGQVMCFAAVHRVGRRWPAK